ncbi:Predicted membrane protein [Amycolatopsis saalfeldensis]|uniref:Predicted membrane protein n=1 Tax=Amycolatopsis saalfeldensis TaxID=394193 RepID=A0A1H8YLU8_9PSEU|nr:Predicted membrane protein [Amycolatopsis saalfeldensis]
MQGDPRSAGAGPFVAQSGPSTPVYGAAYPYYGAQGHSHGMPYPAPPQTQYTQTQYAQAVPQYFAMPPQQPYIPPPTFGERLRKEGAGARVLAWVGGAVTLLGVVLLLVLAVQRGWLGPLPRVLVGAAFGAGLVGVGAWLHRKPVARTGAFALAATGIATLYLDAVAATSLYGFLPVPMGLGAGLVIAVGGLLLAVKWDSSLLAGAVVVGCGLCAPLITWGFTPELVTFLLMLQLATAPVQFRKEWWALSLTAALPPLTTSVIGSALHTQNVPVAVAAGVVSAVLALVTLRCKENDPAALAVLASAVLPVLVAAALLPKTQSALLAGGAAVLLVTTGLLVRGHSGNVAVIAGLVAALQATVTQFDGGAVLLGEAVVLAFAARWTRNRFVLGGAFAFGVIGWLIALVTDVTPALLIVARARTTTDLLTGLVAAVLLLAAAVAVPWAAVRLEVLKPAKLVPWLPAGLAALHGAAGLVLCASLLAIPDRAGFLTGHALITVSWTITALVLLLRGINVVALRVVGLVLVGAAVLKLVLFDLAALDGLARVAAFLGAGLVLMVAGARYARLVASR